MHKSSKTNSKLNLINYMSEPFISPNMTTFIGFMPIHKDLAGGEWGVSIKGDNCCAVHLYNNAQNTLRSDEEHNEGIQIDKGLVWLLALIGSDNTSYMKRFGSKDEAMKWFHGNDCVMDSEDLLYYNS